MQGSNILMAVNTVKRLHFCHDVLLLQLGGMISKDFAGINAATLRMCNKMDYPIIAMTQFRSKFVFLPWILYSKIKMSRWISLDERLSQSTCSICLR